MTREQMIDAAVRRWFKNAEFPLVLMASCLRDGRVPDYIVWNIGSLFREEFRNR